MLCHPSRKKRGLDGALKVMRSRSVMNLTGPPAKFPEECLSEHWFLTLDDARETIESWRIDYNQVRPHSALGYLTPQEFAMHYANVESKRCFPHLHSPDGGCGDNLQLNSKPGALTHAD